jgi:hypothetical protein
MSALSERIEATRHLHRCQAQHIDYGEHTWRCACGARGTLFDWLIVVEGLAFVDTFRTFAILEGVMLGPAA